MILSMCVFLAVILLTVIASKRYNIIYGFVTFFGLTTLLVFVTFLGTKISFIKIPAKYTEAIEWVALFIHAPFILIMEKTKIEVLYRYDYLLHYAVILGVWIVLFVISVSIRKAKKSKARRRELAYRQGAK